MIVANALVELAEVGERQSFSKYASTYADLGFRNFVLALILLLHFYHEI